MSLVEQELLTLPKVIPGFKWDLCCSIVLLFCRSLFVLFLLPLILSVLFDLWLLITPFRIFNLFFSILLD